MEGLRKRAAGGRGLAVGAGPGGGRGPRARRLGLVRDGARGRKGDGDFEGREVVGKSATMASLSRSRTPPRLIRNTWTGGERTLAHLAIAVLVARVGAETEEGGLPLFHLCVGEEGNRSDK